MMCEECKTMPASVLVMTEINGQTQTKRLCASCAQRYQQTLSANFGINFGMNDLLSGLLETVKQSPATSTVCEVCGMTYGKFREGGLLGCAQCYNLFRPQLKPLLQRIHGSTQHMGKIPQRAGGQLRWRKEIEKLQNELGNAIKSEEYERAAQLRDEIRKMQSEKFASDKGAQGGEL